MISSISVGAMMQEFADTKAELAKVRSELAKAREALAVAQAQLITLGGPAVDPWSDAIQRAVLSQIDAVLPAQTEGE